MAKVIRTKKGLKELLRRYRKAGVTNESYIDQWLLVIEGCIKEGLAMDEIDYENTPKELRPLWKGLK